MAVSIIDVAHVHRYVFFFFRTGNKNNDRYLEDSCDIIRDTDTDELTLYDRGTMYDRRSTIERSIIDYRLSTISIIDYIDTQPW